MLAKWRVKCEPAQNLVQLFDYAEDFELIEKNILTRLGFVHKMRASTHDEVLFASPSSSGLGHRPFTAVTGVRVP